MNISRIATLSLVVSFLIISLVAADALAEKTISIAVGEEQRCENLSLSGKPTSGGYRIEDIWADAEGIVTYEMDEDRGLICFKPLAVGSVKIRVRGQRYELKRDGRLKSSEGFYRAFKVRVPSFAVGAGNS
jgi:hypothetical protein